ncbi:MAG: dTDP-glucose 4,6-dehydratase [Proteobacteria bacterium]|nr:dTDP-glucose 4,6-dehydratase [Pseudomonadota bacterium]
MILVTGGAGFIGGNYLHQTEEQIVCVDKLTYAANFDYIKPLIDNGKVIFEYADITDSKAIRDIYRKYKPKYIVNFAAESHVDNSIKNCLPFVDTNILGTINLLQNAMCLDMLEKFIHISTDEIYGSLELDSEDSFKETTQYSPNNPYSASKAASDHFVRAFHKTYDIPAIITNCSNNYGPGQNKEKFIPTIIRKAMKDYGVPVYGDGLNVRDWLYVEDHCRAINLVLEKGKIGEKYNIGGGTEVPNIELVKVILKHLNKPESLIEYVKDRPGHDRRYSINCDKIINELGYKPEYTLEQGIEKTLKWYGETNDTK